MGQGHNCRRNKGIARMGKSLFGIQHEGRLHEHRHPHNWTDLLYIRPDKYILQIAGSRRWCLGMGRLQIIKLEIVFGYKFPPHPQIQVHMVC